MSSISVPSASLSQHSPPDTPGFLAADSDPASQLRQAALLTLKSKRRKPQTVADTPYGSLPPSRPLAAETPSIMLDYGEEESSSAPPTTAAPAPTTRPPSPAKEAASKTDTPQAAQEDVSMREEGEISETEDEPPRPPPSPPRPKTPVKRATPPSPRFSKPERQESPPRLVPTAPVSPASPVREKARMPPPPPASPPRKAAPMPPPPVVDPVTAARLNEELAKLRSIGYVIDENHIRPGLNMTQAQYNAAQDIILDLLGWGVPPEYLVDCGLSREIVYYVFTELNLRLPANLDSTGILPYPPTEAVVAQLLAAAATPRTTRLGSDHAVPHTPQGSISRHTRETSLHATAPPFLPGSHISTSPVPEVSTSLSDMEQQRRQELLKRKVLASRKRKNPNFDAMATSPKVARTMYVDTQQSTRSLAPAASVDDFLNSIGPTPASSSSDRALYGPFSLDAMDVDDIPGLGGSSFTQYAPPRERSMDTIPTPVTAEPQPFQLVSHGAADEDVASSSDESKKPAVPRSDRSNGGAATERASDGSGASGYATPMDGLIFDEPTSTTRPSPAPVVRSGQPLSRRGTKRPVAADFVDADGPHLAAPSSRSMPSRAQSTGEAREDHGNGYVAKAQHPNPHVRRKMKAVAVVGASFANVSNMRRCVIDLSDTEEDDEDDEEEFGKLASAKTPGGATPVGSGAAEKSAHELELEIKRMREMIREREEMRSKKLAAQSQQTARSSTPSVDARAGRSTTTPEVKEEAVEPSGLAVSPPPPEQEARNEDEDVAMPVAENEPSPLPSAATAIAPASVSILDTTHDTKLSVLSTPSDESPPPAAPVLPHLVTGEQVLTAEARQEPVVFPPIPAHPPSTPAPAPDSASTPETGHAVRVDVPASAQVHQASDQAAYQGQEPTRFRPYDSLFSSYPLLGHSLVPQPVATRLPGSSLPDLRPLKLRAFSQHMTALGLQVERLCQYEIPGGGACRDASCGDLHLSRMAVEPSDEDTASYLGGMLSTDEGPAMVLKALQLVRARAPQAPYQERVGEAWASLHGLSAR